MSQTISRCCWRTKKGTECSFKGKKEYNGNYYCQKHLRVMKSKEECSICFMDMDKKDTIELACGHFFHIRCLSQCQKADCPLCRTTFLPPESYRIYKSNVIKPLARSVFAFTSNYHSIIFGMFKNVLNVCSRGQWYIETLYALISSFETFIKAPDRRDEFVKYLREFANQVEQNF